MVQVVDNSWLTNISTGTITTTSSNSIYVYTDLYSSYSSYPYQLEKGIQKKNPHSIHPNVIYISRTLGSTTRKRESYKRTSIKTISRV